MNRSRIILTLVLCGATGLATAQMMPNGSTQPTMPGQSPAGQPGRPGTMGGEIPDNVGGQNNPNAGTQTPKVDDATLERDVKQQLASDPSFAMVQVAAHNGRVELTGSVPSKEDRKKAKDMVKSIPGVSSIKEHLSVGGTHAGSNGAMGNGPAGDNTSASPASHPPQTTTPEANPQSTQPPPSDTTTPHASNTTPQGSGARLVNASYQETGKPQEAMPPSQANPKADSDTQNNSTPLNITLTPTTADNGALQSKIENAMQSDPTLSTSRVAVNVTDTTIDLSGTVGSSKDKLAAERIAQSFGVNRKLNDKLTVTGQSRSTAAQSSPAANNGNATNQTASQHR